MKWRDGMVYDGILIGLVVGFIRGGFFGALRGLSQLKLVAGWIFPLLLILQLLVFYFQEKIEFIRQSSGSIFILVYLVGLFFLFLNRKRAGIWIIFVGVLLNFLVISFNGGAMPVSPEAAAVLGGAFLENLQGNEIVYKHAALMENTKLPFLADIIPLTSPYPRKMVISIGDIIMNIGIYIFLQRVMIDNNKYVSS
jgi:hypothetical protein